MKSFTLTTVLLALLGFQVTTAQNKILDKINQITTAANNAKPLFDKKKNKSSSTDASDASKTKTANGLNPGDVAPDAKTIDADMMYPFNGGAALITKGSAMALIDSHGNFIIPFNKYELASLHKTSDKYGLAASVRFNGFFTYDSIGWKKIITARGKRLGEKNAEFTGISKDGRYAIFKSAEDRYTFIDTAGRKIYFQNSHLNNSNASVDFWMKYGEDCGPIRFDDPSRPSGSSYSYTNINLKNQFSIKEKFDDAEAFSQGLACVGRRDAFGIMQYGFIDKKGNIVIPLTYSIKPTNFSSGLSQITPKDQTEFTSAFINKKGDIVIKCTKLYSPFANGYSFYPDNIMDTAGRIVKTNDFFANLGVNVKARETAYVMDDDKGGMVHDGKIRFQRTQRSPEDQNTTGYFDLATKKVVDFNFHVVGNSAQSLWFDPGTKLAYAEKYLGKDSSGKLLWRKGYINEDGIFVIVKSETSKW